MRSKTQPPPSPPVPALLGQEGKNVSAFPALTTVALLSSLLLLLFFFFLLCACLGFYAAHFVVVSVT